MGSPGFSTACDGRPIQAVGVGASGQAVGGGWVRSLSGAFWKAGPMEGRDGNAHMNNGLEFGHWVGPPHEVRDSGMWMP